MRIDKFIANNSEYSRSQIHLAIKRGLVLVNDITVNKASHSVTAADKIVVDGKQVEEQPIRYLMLHKPAGYVCANIDSEHPTVLDLVDLPFKQNLQIAGRLDVDTTGLVLLTDDGEWNHKITSPKHQHTKSYWVTTAEIIDATAIEIFAKGILLHGETKPTLPAQLEIIEPRQARLLICEGKYHQVKRMFAATGNRVTQLHRESIGNINLDETLKPGHYRPLTLSEINSIGIQQ